MLMADGRNKGRQNTHDTGSPVARARDDLPSGHKKEKQKDDRDEKRDKKDDEQTPNADE